MLWFEQKAEERKPGKDTGPKLGKNQVWVPKYPMVDDILRLYGEPDGRGAADARLPEMAPEDRASFVADVIAALEPEF